MLQAEPDLIQSTRVLPKSTVHSSCSRDVLLKIGRNLDRKPARQSSLPIHKFPTAVPFFIPTASNKSSLHLDFAAKQMLPAVPAWVPGKGHNGGIKPELKLPAHVATQSFVRIELAIADRKVKSAVCLLWHKGQNLPGKEYVTWAGALAHNQQRSESTIWEEGRSLGIGQDGVIV